MDNEKNIPIEVLHKEIDLIQSCIKRMATCSFSLKGWYISLITLALTLLIGQGCKLSIMRLFLFAVTTVFWGLDGFFLKTETLYRWKYEWIIKVRKEDNDDFIYDLNPMRKEMWLEPEKKNYSLMKFVLSKTLIPLYGLPCMISIGILIYVILSY